METNMNGANKLAERILSDARADAERTLSEARASADALRRESEARLQALSADYAAKREAAANALVEGSRTRASLDARKAALAKKRAVIDEAFVRAYQDMCALDVTARGAICRRMLEAEAEGGETVVPARRTATRSRPFSGSCPMPGYSFRIPMRRSMAASCSLAAAMRRTARSALSSARCATVRKRT